MEKMNYLYETGVVYPDVLGSSDQKCNEFHTRNESEAFEAYTKGRNYLIRYHKSNDRKIVEHWDPQNKEWF